MPDPTLHSVVDSVVSKLAAAVAGTVYEPGVDYVKPLSNWPDAAILERIGASTFYAVIPGGEGDTPEVRGLPDSGTITGRLPIEIYALRRVSAAGNPLNETTPRWQVAADVSVDIEQKLIAAENAKVAPIVTYLDGPMQVRMDYADQWVIVQMRFNVRYRKDRTTR